MTCLTFYFMFNIHVNIDLNIYINIYNYYNIRVDSVFRFRIFCVFKTLRLYFAGKDFVKQISESDQTLKSTIVFEEDNT